MVFPNHQVERKAQRSPSLRLRFGRSDPDLLPSAPSKRWFGDVDQKPIRSPSRRLRFGRSDPSMPIHSAFDILMNAQQDAENNNDNTEDNFNRIARQPPRLRWGRSLPWEDDNKKDNINRVSRQPPRLRWGRSLSWGQEENKEDGFNRVARYPPRLRWGRSLPFQSLNNANENEWSAEGDNDNANDVNEDLSNSDDDEIQNSLLQSIRLGNLLRSLQKYTPSTGSSSDFDVDMNEFERAIRKPGPLRLRWGRSTGGKVSAGEKEQKNSVEEKVSF